MTSRRVALLALVASLGGCQAILGLEEGKEKDAGGGGSTSSSSSASSAGGGTATASSSSAGGGTATSSSSSAGGGTATSSSSSVGGGTATSSSTGTGGATSSTSSTGAGGAGGSGGATSTAASSSSGPSCDPVTCGAQGKKCDPNGACVECLMGSDCTSGVCSMGACQAPACNDGVKNGTETGVDCGGSCPICPTVLLLAGGTSGSSATVVTGEYHPGGAWVTGTLAATTADAPALAIDPSGQAVGLIRFTKLNDPADNQVQSMTWMAASGFTAFTGLFTPPAVPVTTQARPTIAFGTAMQAAFHGQNFKHFYAGWTGSLWSPVAELVGGMANQSYGPVAPDLAAIGADATLAFLDGSNGNHATAQDRTGGAWQPKVDLSPLASQAPNPNVPPAIAALTSGPELLVVFAHANDNQLLWTARTSGVWSAPATVPSAFSATRPALAGLAGGSALLAFRGTNNKLYTSTFSGGSWSAMATQLGASDLASAPAVAHGVGTAAAELAYVDTTNKVFHTRFIANAWTAPVQAATGAGIATVAIASGP